MQVATRIAVHTVVELVGRKNLVQSLCNARNVGKKRVSLLFGYVYYFAYVLLVGDYAPAALGLFFKEYKL